FKDFTGKDVDSATHLAPMYGRNMVQSLKNYFSFRNVIGDRIANFTPGQFFIVGGVNLTPIVARKIFTRYSIPEEVKNSFMTLIANYTDFEKAQFNE
ncbi:MAG: hypothetical protein HQM08_29320, partial [Candidatus Riflebacteria bacterium]|nr:hypothetical protein [Candidatus Riflebacteria bacterium]